VRRILNHQWITYPLTDGVSLVLPMLASFDRRKPVCIPLLTLAKRRGKSKQKTENYKLKRQAKQNKRNKNESQNENETK